MSTTSDLGPGGSSAPAAATTPYPLSAVQQTLLLDPYIARRLVSCCVEITPEVDTGRVLSAVDHVLREHPGLTTRMHRATDGTTSEPVWVQAPEPTDARDVVDVRAPSTDDTATIVRRELDALRAMVVDPREGLATRATLTPTPAGAVLVLVAHHLLMDALSRPILIASLDRALRADPLPLPDVAEDRIRGLVEAEHVTSRRTAGSATVRILEEDLRSTSPCALGFRETGRDQPAHRVSLWLEPDEYEAFHRARSGLGVTSYTLLLSAVLIELSVRGASGRPAVMTVRTRRSGRGTRSVIGTFADAIVVTAPRTLGPGTAVSDVAAEVASTLFRRLATKENLIDILPSSPALQDYLAGEYGPIVAFQYIDVTPPAPSPSGPRAQQWYRSETEVNFDGMGLESLHVICTDHGNGMEIAAWHPGGAFPDGTVHGLMRGLLDRALSPDGSTHPTR